MPHDSPLGRILLGRYRALRLLGAGAHGRAYLAEDLSRGGARVALKIVEGLVGGGQDEPGQEELRWFRHPCWAEVLDDGRFAEYDVFQVTRYVDGPSLDRVAGAQPEAWVWRFLEDGARVLRALHARGLIHYDVTPGNWIVEGPSDAPRFVLTDGGLAHRGPVQGFARGTPLYMAPEVTEDRRHDHRVDLYSLGLVAYRLATGAEPLSGGAGDVLGRRRREPAPHVRARRPDLSEALDQVIAGLLAPDPSERIPTAGHLLERLRARHPELPRLTPTEAAEAATGGICLGRDAVRARFSRVLDGLAQHLPSGRTSGAPVSRSQDPVLLLRGPSGSGGTRLARELALLARRSDVPVLVLAGREGAPDPAQPLRHLLEGLEALGAAEPATGADRPGPAHEPGPRAHADARAIEQLVAAVDAAARRTPLLLVVEDLADLPELAQRAVHVLSRHILARAERITGAAPVPVALVVDAGDADTAPCVPPDAQDPERPCAQLGPLSHADLALLAHDRFPGLALAPHDREALARACDGLPGRCVALLAEAFLRGDLAYEGSTVTWDLSRLASYPPASRLPPSVQHALGEIDAPLRSLLQHLALLEGDVTLPVALHVLHALAPERTSLPPTPLLAVREAEGERVVALASLAVRHALVRDLTAQERRAASSVLLPALDAHPDARNAVDRVALRVALGRMAEALDLAHRERAQRSPEQRVALQAHLRRAVEADPALLSTPASRRQVAEVVDRGPDAPAVLQALVAALPGDGRELEAVLLTARLADEVLDGAVVRKFVERHTRSDTTDLPRRAELLVLLTRLCHMQRSWDAAAEALAAARRLIRSLGPVKRAHPGLLAQFLKTEAILLSTNRRLDRALRGLTWARRLAYRVRNQRLYSEVLNNLGILHAERGEKLTARTRIERALRLRRAQGDLVGATRLQINLGRVHRSSANPARAASCFNEAASLASRHGLNVFLVDALRELASTIDMQHSTQPAIECLRRALRVAERSGIEARMMPVVRELAPGAAAAGHGEAILEAVRAAASAARRRTSHDARATFHMTLATIAAVLGQDCAARVSVSRALRHAGALPPHIRTQLYAVSSLADVPRRKAPRCDRPTPGAADRASLRTAVRLAWTTSRGGSYKPVKLPMPTPLAQLEANDRRLCVALALKAIPRASPAPAPDYWKALEALLESTSEKVLLSRLLALHTRTDNQQSPGARAQTYSRAVALLPVDLQGLPRRLASPPLEHLALAPTPDLPMGAGGAWLRELHASAHRRLLDAGRAPEQDSRRADALHQVLAVTAQMEAGVSLDALLHTITRNAVQITSAQRACVVLVDAQDGLQMRVASSVTPLGQELKTHELSNTVLRRVLANRKPLLMHDAFGDEELLGRPSVTALSLRSILCVPMLRNGEMYGVMYADSASAAGSFDQVDLEVLSLFAEQAAAAIATNRMVTKLQTAYADLRNMQDRLVRSERLRVIGEVSSGVAHEFNNLLTAILARVQLMSLTADEPEQRQHLGLIEKATLDAAGVVKRLQSFSREQRTSKFQQLLLGELCNDAVEFLRPLWSTRRRHGRPSIHVRLSCPPGLHVRGNPTELREVLTNLLKNAVEALNEKGGVIQVTGHADAEWAEVRVQDDGPGIAPDVLPNLFSPFFTTKGEGGTGLGLCLSQRIAEQHGGELHLTSSPGRGTVASLRVPLLPPPASGRTRGAGAGVSDTATPRELRVLIVDDDADVLRPLCAYLERSGYNVSAAQDGREALQVIPTQVPDVLLSDIGMPNMDGLELCRQARALRPDLPVVLMSGWASEVDPATAQAVGAKALLAKPFAMQQVTDLLLKVAKESR